MSGAAPGPQDLAEERPLRVAVLGLGLIGGSIGLACRRRAGVLLTGYDPDAGTRRRALDRGAIERAASSVAEAVSGADVVFAAAPVSALPETVGAALQDAPEGCVITDVGSTKRELLSGLGDHLASGRFVGGHPLAGSEHGGIEHAREDLFDGALWCLTPPPAAWTAGRHAVGAADPRRERLRRLIESLGASTVEIDPAAHDRTMARISHLPHVLANVLTIVAGGGEAPSLQLAAAGPSFRDATRVAGASSAIWTGIYLSNADMLAIAIEETIDGLQEVSQALRDGDEAALRAWNELARSRRQALLRSAERAEGGSGTA